MTSIKFKNLQLLKNVFVAIIIAMSIFACGTDKEEVETETSYYIRAKINGMLVEMKEQKTLQGLAGNNGVQHTAYIEGENASQQAITIHFFDNEPIKTAAYTGYELVTGNIFKGVNIGYIFDASTVYATALENPSSSASISVLNDKEIKGTFSGIIRDPLTSEALTVSEGVFYVKKIQ